MINMNKQIYTFLEEVWENPCLIANAISRISF